MTKVLTKALKIMALDYLKRRVNKDIYNRWDNGYYGRVPLPELPYELNESNDDVLKAIIFKLESE